MPEERYVSHPSFFRLAEFVISTLILGGAAYSNYDIPVFDALFLLVLLPAISILS